VFHVTAQDCQAIVTNEQRGLLSFEDAVPTDMKADVDATEIRNVDGLGAQPHMTPQHIQSTNPSGGHPVVWCNQIKQHRFELSEYAFQDPPPLQK